MTVWYPEQNLTEPVAYPWCVRSLGPRCWVVDTTIGNGWNDVDFGSHNSSGHVIRYLCGAPLRHGLYVSKSERDGWVEDIQFNPHYAARLPQGLPQPDYSGYKGDLFGHLIEYQRDHLEGIVIGRCKNEHLRGTFIYAGYDGLSFRDDNGRPKAFVIQHGSDTVSRSVFVESGDIEAHLTQLTPLAAHAVGAFVTDPKFNGNAKFFNSQIWAGNVTAKLDGPGSVTLSQFNTITGPVFVNAGKAQIVNGVFASSYNPAVGLGPNVTSAQVIANTEPGAFAIDNQSGERAFIRANSATLGASAAGPAAKLPADKFNVKTSFEPGQPIAPANTLAKGGGRRAVSAFACEPVDGAGREGGRAVRLLGVADDPEYAFVYAKLIDGPWGVSSDSLLSYWIKPENERGRMTSVDISFTDGSTMRDSITTTTEGGSARSAGGLAKVGEWRQVKVPLGAHTGKVIDEIMIAYDARGGGGPFSLLVDDVALTSESVSAGEPLVASLVNGQVTLSGAEGQTVRYTLDGTTPTAQSPRYAAPVALPGAGLHELRWRRENAAGQLFGPVGSFVW